MKARFARQSFLGPGSEKTIESTIIGIVGLGGGGSHISLQASHIGFRNVVAVDPDIAEDTNLNRLVGATPEDVKNRAPKVEIAQRIAKAISPDMDIRIFQTTWQETGAAQMLRSCTVIFGCLDSLKQREELERFCRRFQIIYIDIGMDVHKADDRYSIHGQVCLSVPGGLCLRCMGIVNDERITKEVQNYGAAGPKPQVIWPNGVLASTAIGVCMQLLTAWDAKVLGSCCWEYDGNSHEMKVSNKMIYLQGMEGFKCVHHKAEDIGDAFWCLNQ